jgi:tripartite-type tricarboxylate transporter receptor subunit TctC
MAYVLRGCVYQSDDVGVYYAQTRQLRYTQAGKIIAHPVQALTHCANPIRTTMTSRNLLRQNFHAILGTVFIAALWPNIVTGQAFPQRPVRVIVPFSTGTAADIVARHLGSRLAETWGQGVVIENQAGAGGNIGAASVAKAAPDGHTLLMAGINQAINPGLYKDLPFDTLRDFKPVVRVALAPLAFVAHPGFSANTVPEMIALAHARPGSIQYGSGGNSSITHLAVELLKARAGINLAHIPYKGVAQMLTDVLGNQIPLACPAVASVLTNVKAGKLKALAITSAKRSSMLPEVPTVAESGFRDYDVSAWNGLIAPARVTDEVVAKIHGDAAKIAQGKDFVDLLQAQALEIDILRPAEFRAFLAAELGKWSKLVKDSGAKLD